MTLDELIERLTEIRENYEVSGDTVVRGAFQPNYPLIAAIAAVTTIVSDTEAGIYIALGDAREYGLKAMWDDELVERESEDDDED